MEDYFELRRSERYGLATVIILGLLFFCVRLHCNQRNDTPAEDLEQFLEIVNSDKSKAPNSDIMEAGDTELRLSPFNPNEVSKETLFSMGLPPSAVKSIINYRASGFEYRKPEDLLKCYGVDQVLFDQIAPYVVLLNKNELTAGVQWKGDNSSNRKSINPFRFDPNTVSREDLVKMNLSDKFIKGFLNYRNSGAQFYNLQDFEKLYVLTPEIKEALRPYLLFPERPRLNQHAKVADIATPSDIQRFRFDPNRISKDSLLLLGIKASVANIWDNYRKGGMVFYSTNDLKSIYGLSESQLSDLSDLMDFPTVPESEPIKKVYAAQPGLNIDPNVASLEDLTEIKGIGRYYANQILWRKKQLGGYCKIDQIGETENLPDSTFLKIKYHFIQPSLDSLKKINVNTTRRRPFADHPYITYDRVNRIITHREFVGKIKDINYLLKVELLSSKEAELLGPYLTFD